MARVGRGEVAAAVQRLSAAYREQGTAAARAARTDADAAAYVAYRAPATYAAAVFVLSRLAEQRPDWRPRTVLDAGAGPGMATWAAAAVWPGLEQATLVEIEQAMARAGRALSAAAPVRAVREATWVDGDVAAPGDRADLVLVSYVLNELRLEDVEPAARSLWERAGDTLLFLEPGTPDGYRRVLAARDAVLGAGGVTLAPCPHDDPCPLAAGDWCHFAVRLARSAAHRAAKGVTRGFEDEKLAYAALGRAPAPRPRSRVIRQPEIHGGHVYLDLCEPEGVRRATVTRRDKDAFRQARKAAWGDAFDDRP